MADQLEPVMVLGEPQGKKKKRDCGSTFAVAGHTAEVLTLHRNAQRLYVLPFLLVASRLLFAYRFVEALWRVVPSINWLRCGICWRPSA